MNIHFDLIIAGAGPAGIFAAIQVAKENFSVLLLEKEDKLLKKFLISGSGKCNLTHVGDWNHFKNHYGASNHFLKNSFYQFDNHQLLNFFERQGFNFYATKEGKYFPSQHLAKLLADSLLLQAKQAGVRIQKESALLDFEFHHQNKTEKKKNFIINTLNETYSSEFLILAGGGCSYPCTGSDGTLLQLVAQKGIRIVKPQPALTPVIISDFDLGALKGNTLSTAHFQLKRKGILIMKQSGSLLITQKGFSGPPILNISRNIQPKDHLIISFNGNTKEQNRERIYLIKKEKGALSLKKAIHSMDISSALTKWICEKLSFDTQRLKIADCSKQNLLEVIMLMSEYSFEIQALNGWNHAMVTAGGIDKRQINPATMESKEIENLFFAGEIIDIDGDTGGYNLQAAFSTGYCAAHAIVKKLR